MTSLLRLILFTVFTEVHTYGENTGQYADASRDKAFGAQASAAVYM